MKYIHDIEFTPCGNFIGVACRENHTVAIFKVNYTPTFSIDEMPCWIAHDKDASLNNPTSLCFSPSGHLLIVCNRMGGDGIIFFKQVQDGIYENTPFFKITEANLAQKGISAPHGVAFSPDGKSIAVVHKKFFKSKEKKGQGALAIFDIVEDSQQRFKGVLSFSKMLGNLPMHAVSFHPSGDYLAMVCETFGVEIYKKQLDGTYVPFHRFPVKGISKGLDFLPNGNIVVTTETPAVYIYSFIDN